MAKPKKRKKKPVKPAIRRPKKKVKKKKRIKKRFSKTEKIKQLEKELSLTKDQLAEQKKQIAEDKLKIRAESSIYKIPKELPPEGFELVPIDAGTLTEALNKIQRLFQVICETVPINCLSRVHDYPLANEVDGELWVVGVSGYETPDIIAMIQEAMLPDVPPSNPDYNLGVLGIGYWMTVGIRWQGTGSPEEDHYKKWHGLQEVSSNYRSMSNESRDGRKISGRAKINSDFAAMTMPSSRNPIPIIEGVEEKYGQKSAEVFLKIVWNSRNQQPSRHISVKQDEDLK
jgi:hypothetical protein